MSPEEEQAQLEQILGKDAAAEAPTLNRETEIKTDWEGRPVNPHNKPMHPSVTAKFYTEGGKEVKAVHDEMGTLWHIEFSPGGQLPEDLKGKFTNETMAKDAIKLYLAK
jgi:hypothetical protein